MEELVPTTFGTPPGAAEPCLDLAEVHGAVRLIQVALQSAAETGLPPEGFRSRPDDAPINPRTLLTVLIYSLARGIYDLEALEGSLRSDPDLRYVCAHRFPDSHTLRQFRRRHWQAVEAALASLIRRSVGETDTAFCSPGEPEAEARRRLQLSIWTDTVD